MNLSIPVNNVMEYIEDTKISPYISHVKIKVCWVGQQPNRNHTVITKDVALEMGRNLPGSPIVGYYNKDNKDFEQHNRELNITEDGEVQFIDTTFPYGFVPTDAKVWFQWFSDSGVKREYLCTEGYVWTGAYPESKRMVDKGNNQSMELDRQDSPGHWADDVNSGHRIFIYNEALIKKLCVLGEHFEPCFEGASISGYSLNSQEFEEFKTTMFSMINELKEAINKGGSDMEENKNTLPVEGEEATPETFAAEETVEETPTEAPAQDEFAKKDEEEKTSEDNSDKENTDKNEDNNEEEKSEDEDEDKKKKYNLEEVVEYQELTQKYATLEAQLNELQEKYNALETENNGLREFKLAGERKAKEDMIAKFYMLDDAAKKECIDNVDNYSLEEIESRLSVYCFRNGINFASEENKSEEQEIQPTVFNLNNQEDADDAPEWVKAVRRFQNKEEF